ncbi:MAG: hypothetical protein SV186_04520 [Candidatus Nanohaloarchaea archaeon]|nr:hypothetical protein [Candidatus Nanohaloarchaea archaeon]
MYDKQDDQYRVLVGRVETTVGAFSPAEDPDKEDIELYVVTDGDDAGLYTSIDSAGDAVAEFFDSYTFDGDGTPLLVTPETHSLDRMDGQAADELDYDLDDIPDSPYQELLDQADIA